MHIGVIRAQYTVILIFSLSVLSTALSLDDHTGNFEVGKDFDALRVNVAVPGGPIDLIQSEGPKVGSGALWLVEHQPHTHTHGYHARQHFGVTQLEDGVWGSSPIKKTMMQFDL